MEIELKPFQREDFTQLIAWGGSPEFLMQWAPNFIYPLDERQLEEHMKEAEIDPPLRKIFKVITTTNNAVVGHIELDRISGRDRCATLSRVLVGDGSLRGKGIGTEMVKKALKIGFDELSLHRIDLGVYDFNEKAIACYEKIGFIKEGYLQDAKRICSEYGSIYRMRILEDEWRKIY